MEKKEGRLYRETASRARASASTVEDWANERRETQADLVYWTVSQHWSTRAARVFWRIVPFHVIQHYFLVISFFTEK